MVLNTLTLLKQNFVKFGATNTQDLARKWLLNKLESLKVSRKTIMSESPKSVRDSTIIGKMYFYYYDPLNKQTLPFYDKFPLVIPIEMYPDGSWLGLNLHYLSPDLRLKLLDKLTEFKTNNRYDATTKLKLSYNLLQGTKKFKLTKPCLKRYLPTHVRSRFLEIPANEWDIAMCLPVEQFVKETKQQVWNNSRRIAG